MEGECREAMALEDPREHISLVFIGHVDAGKSTICGQLMVLAGLVGESKLQACKEEAKNNNRETWLFAYLLDTYQEERERGKTLQGGRTYFATKSKRYTILDVPGLRNYLPCAIETSTQADVAVLVVSTRPGEFENGFMEGNQTREHTRNAKIFGLKYLLVLINKMDAMVWDKQRFDECVNTIIPFVKNIGYDMKDVQFVPVSGLKGTNMLAPPAREECQWYDGPTMISCLDTLPLVERKVDAPLRIPVVDSFQERIFLENGKESEEKRTTILGKIESGTITIGQTVFLMPGKLELQVMKISLHADERFMYRAKAGENVKMTVRGHYEFSKITSGLVVCDADLVPCVTECEVVLALMELNNSKCILSAGFEAIMHIHTCVVDCTVSELVAILHTKKSQPTREKETGENTQKETPKQQEQVPKGEVRKLRKPVYARSHSVVKCIMQISQPIPVESFATLSRMGRFILRDGGTTVAMGKITSLNRNGAE